MEIIIEVTTESGYYLEKDQARFFHHKFQIK